MFWGLTPALDLQQELKENGKCTKEINILIVGGQDCRHIIRTLAGKYRNEDIKINFYVMEAILETISKQLLLLNVVLQPDHELGIIQKTRYFMELYGNTLIRPAVAQYLKLNAMELIESITDYERLKKLMPFLELELKYKERDYIENVFKFWCSSDEFNVSECWDRRVRRLLGVRYDSKIGSFDWDLHMRYHNVGGKQVCSQEYKHWRSTGIAFTWLESEVSISNRSFVCAITSNGQKFVHYGYLGDIQTGPYVAYGLNCEDPDFTKSSYGLNAQRSTDVTERNLRQYFHEIHNKNEYIHTKINDLNLGNATFIVSEHKVVDYGASGDVIKKKNRKCIDLDYAVIKFVSLNNLKFMQHKKCFHNFFDLIYFGSSYLTYLDPVTIELICAPKDKELEEFEKNIMSKIESIKCIIKIPFNVKKDHYAKFSLKV
ncbi:hypothetical protein FQA39_LY14296 [Lamprigera yunnana]|nr:hypothetical protein FQA39_LY14296 [Lamprigera yunnana]